MTARGAPASTLQVYPDSIFPTVLLPDTAVDRLLSAHGASA